MKTRTLLNRSHLRLAISRQCRINPLPLVDALESRLFLSASDLDTTFGIGGIARTTAGGNSSEFSAVAMAPGGKYVAAGDRNGSFIDFIVSRFNANGTPDKTFGGTGSVLTDFGGLDVAMDLAILPTGKILVAGYGADTDGHTSLFCVARYNTDGTLDKTFGGGDGKVTTAFGTNPVYTGRLAVLSSGKFIVVGTGHRDFALARYNADGTPDTTFGSAHTGKVLADFGGTAAAPAGQEATDVAVNAIGQIFVTGAVSLGNDRTAVAVARFAPGGVMDSGFGNGKGWVKTDLGASTGANSEGMAVAITPAGKVLVAARFLRGFALIQYNTGGSLDTTFGGGTGKVLTTTNMNVDPLSSSKPVNALNPVYVCQDMAVTTAGKIVVAGYTYGLTYDPNGLVIASTNATGVARYNANGSLDSTFGVDGKLQSLALDAVQTVMVDAIGKIILAGSLNHTAALARLGTPAVATSSISGTFFNDKNGDGVRQTTSEPLLADWQAYVDTNNNGVYDFGEPTAFTNAAGTYTIKGLHAGTYRVREVRKDGWNRTKPAGAWPLGYYDVTVATGAAATGKVFGNRKIA